MLSNIDRVFLSTSWEERFPLCVLRSLTRIGSDHCPLILNDGVRKASRGGWQFFFEKTRFLQEGFCELIQQKWLRVLII